jgi:anti-sigma B factor antagonist
MRRAVRHPEFEVEVIGPPHPTMHVVVRGELDIARTDAVEGAFAKFDGTPEVVVLDLRPLGFIDSSGLRCVMRLRARAEEQGQQFVLLCRRNGAVHDVMRVTGLEGILRPIFDGDQASADG